MGNVVNLIGVLILQVGILVVLQLLKKLMNGIHIQMVIAILNGYANVIVEIGLLLVVMFYVINGLFSRVVVGEKKSLLKTLIWWIVILVIAM